MVTPWRSWLQGITPRLCLLFCATLLLAHAAAALVLHQTGSLVHPLSYGQALERLAVARTAVDRLPAAQADALLRVLAEPPARLWMATTPEVAPFPMLSEERRLVRDLARRLGQSEAGLVMQLESIAGEAARASPLTAAGWAPLQLRSSLALPDGRWLNAVQYPARSDGWLTALGWSLLLGAVPVLLLGWLLIGQLVRPLRQLTRAAEGLSRGERSRLDVRRGPREARELAAAFELMQERLLRHLDDRVRMLAAISHDFNTPLAALRVQLALLEPSVERDDMEESLGELDAMVQETLDFIRGERQTEAHQDVDLSALLQDLHQRYRALGQPVTWSGAGSTLLRGRPLALKRALGNLLDNALQHGGSATLELSRPAPQLLRLDILDDGPGLPEDQLERVFEPFYRPPGQDSARGLGLGLAIARACILAHGGELQLHNRLQGGLCARVLLPSAT
ncbi:HAMP domain-containing sensor histidine kinase [uncultured Pseudomonas sp.]|uniref:sensor histidine kinase n=1 Tax=uncultured Pseudomonas sp. TaxID=114707 RepID=UPI0025E3742B|nr:HAMP domain-containing sensor histidine kinase [uncultured Pseudomonas sp.]